MILTQEDIAEMLVILNHALSDCKGDDKEKEAIRAWIRRLSQHIK